MAAAIMAMGQKTAMGKKTRLQQFSGHSRLHLFLPDQEFPLPAVIPSRVVFELFERMAWRVADYHKSDFTIFEFCHRWFFLGSFFFNWSSRPTIKHQNRKNKVSLMSDCFVAVCCRVLQNFRHRISIPRTRPLYLMRLCADLFQTPIQLLILLLRLSVLHTQSFVYYVVPPIYFKFLTSIFSQLIFFSNIWTAFFKKEPWKVKVPLSILGFCFLISNESNPFGGITCITPALLVKQRKFPSF